jgi:hypothetical protein
MSNTPSDHSDDDPTEELPVLLETALDDEGGAPSALPHADHTAQHRALKDAVDEESGALELRSALAEREARVTGLELQMAALAERTRELEHHLAEKDQVIGELKHRVASSSHSAHDTSAAERRLATQLAVRDARIAELTTTIEHLRRDLAASSTQTEQLRMAAATARREADSLRSELAARPAGSAPAPDIQELLEEKATLAAYIAVRRDWWDRANAEQSDQAAQITALQRELAIGNKRLGEAEAFAARESSRAVALRAQLVDSARQVRTLEHELRALRTDGPGRAMPSGAAAVETRTDGPVDSRIALPSRAAAAMAREPQGASLRRTDASGATSPAEAVAELEAEVQYKQQQVSAQLVELRDREQQLRAATSDIERIRAELTAMRNELDASRTTVARLERAVIDKDRALETRDVRIAALQQELEHRFAFENSDAIELAPKRDTPSSGAGRVEADEEVPAPALLCLTGDAPERFPLTKQAVTIGRGPQCDLQLLTHFVSREHARITLHGGRAVIEDAGSRNGVFVNSVRVDRQMLQQGDLVTIGDTQFRFVESMAH